jgi:hypothetical protein
LPDIRLIARVRAAAAVCLFFYPIAQELNRQIADDLIARRKTYGSEGPAGAKTGYPEGVCEGKPNRPAPDPKHRPSLTKWRHSPGWTGARRVERRP